MSTNKQSKEKTPDRVTTEKPTKDGWNHSTTYNKQTNERWSVDTKETGVRGPGTNWTEVRKAHHTDQNDNSHDDNRRWGQTKKK